MSFMRLVSLCLISVSFAAGCCSSSSSCFWNRMTGRNRSAPAPAEVVASEGPVLDDCNGPIPPMAPPGLMPPVAPPGVSEGAESQSMAAPRRLFPRPRAQDMPYSP
jgi:hypothetical protein